MKRSVTLVELTISIVLLGVIVLAVVAFHTASRKLFYPSATKLSPGLIDEAGFLLAHISKHTLRASGDIKDMGIIRDDQGAVRARLYLRQINNTTDDYSDDAWAAYDWSSAGPDPYTVYFCDNLASSGDNCYGTGSEEVLSSRVMNFDFAANNINSSVPPNQAWITNLTLRYDPAFASDPSTNPQITISSPGNIAKNTSFAHSIN